jgi:hypothetical protein
MLKIPPSDLTAHADIINGQITVYPCNDTLTSQTANSSQLWYNDLKLQLGYGAGATSQRIGWFKFNMTSSYVGAINITSATVYFYVQSVDFAPSSSYWYLKSIAPTNETWIDKTITWNNQPSRYNFTEAPGVTFSNTPNTWYQFSLTNTFPINSTEGITALQTAYNHNRTKTYVLYTNTQPQYQWITSKEGGANKAKLVITYTQTIASQTVGAPYIANPETHSLEFFAKEDSQVNSIFPNMNYNGMNISQDQWSNSSGARSDIYLKFNMTWPDLVDGAANANFSLATIQWHATLIVFHQYCDFAPYLSPSWLGYDVLKGIPRTEENWSASLITWNNRPATLRTNELGNQYISSAGWKEFDISTDENLIRANVLNRTTYTLVNLINQRLTSQAYYNWRMIEYAKPMVPWILMTVETGTIPVSVPQVLTLFNAPSFLARSWSMPGDLYGQQGYFIAGILISSMLYMVTVLPIAWIMRKSSQRNIMLTIASIGALVMFTFLTWLDWRILTIIILVTLVTQGGKIKDWLGF